MMTISHYPAAALAARPWSPLHWRYLLLETAISLLVTTVLSAVFAYMLLAPTLPLGPTNPILQIDALFQALSVAFMGSLIPTLIARQRRRSGALSGSDTPHRWPRSTLLRSLAIALLIGMPAAGVHLLITSALGVTFAGLTDLLVYKALFGDLVALLATPLAVTLALRDVLNH